MKLKYLNIVIVCLFFVGSIKPAEEVAPSTEKAVIALAVGVAISSGVYFGYFRESDQAMIERSEKVFEKYAVCLEDLPAPADANKIESFLVSYLGRFGISVEDIDFDFHLKFFNPKVNEVDQLKRSLWWRGLSVKSWYVDPSINAYENQIEAYEKGFQQACDFWEKHADFVKAYQIVNFCNLWPEDTTAIIKWINSHIMKGLGVSSSFPFIVYRDYQDAPQEVQIIESWVKSHAYLNSDLATVGTVARLKKSIKWLDSLNINRTSYPMICSQAKKCRKKLVKMIELLEAFPAYRDEIDRYENMHLNIMGFSRISDVLDPLGFRYLFAYMVHKANHLI